MLGCRQISWLILLAGLPAAGVRATDSSFGKTRVVVLVAAQNVFSRRTAGHMEHLGSQRFEREPGWEVVDAEDLIRKGRTPGSSQFIAAVRELSRGLSDYENLELNRAVTVLSRAVGRFEKVPAELFGERGKNYIKALTFLGASLILQGDPQGGQDAFRRLLVYDRRAQLDESLFPPEMVGTFETVRQDVLMSLKGSLSVFSSPSHGKVYIDGVFRGVSPCTIESLAAGRHLVVVRKAGFKTWGSTAMIEAGEEQKTRVRLVGYPEAVQLLKAIDRISTELDDDELEEDLQELAEARKLDRFVLGRLQQRGQGVYFLLCLYDVSSGEVIRSHQGVVNQEERDFAHAVDAIFTYLITGREDVLRSIRTVAVGGATLRLKDEELFEQDDEPIYKRWYFWTACVVGAASVATLLALLLSGGDQEPRSQILLEF